MKTGIRVRELLVLVPLVVVGFGGTFAALGARDADEAFLHRQENPSRVTTAAVEKLILTAPDPNAPHRRSATDSRCRAEGKRELQNPWRCTVSYPSQSSVPFRVIIRPDGSYVARYLDDDSATATGCCLEVPTAE